jgi:iron complex outermembrane receptor protein
MLFVVFNKKIIKMFFKKLSVFSFMLASLYMHAQDTTKVLIQQQLDEVSVEALRASEKTPMSYSNISQKELEEQNLGQDLPYLLSLTPSVVTTSDAGAGVGYTGFRVRGSDPTRINVTINGIPLNDPESHGVWWVNMPDFSSSVDNIQIQRGVGTSTNGAGAFGASVNLKTDGLRTKAYATTSNSYGSYETFKHNLEFGTGLLNDKFTLDGRLSQLKSDGYIDRASSDLKSIYLSGAMYGIDDLLKLTVFSGKEITYQAWNGVPLSYLQDDTLRTFNSYTYDNEVDDYQQTHFHLNYSKQITSKSNIHLGGHYTLGKGYYEQYKEGEDLADYGLQEIILSSDTIGQTDLIRRKWLDNDFYGLVFNYNNQVGSFDYNLGGAWNIYEGQHFGEIAWAQYASNSSIRQRYYDNDATKEDLNYYAKVNYTLGKANLFVDVQKRLIDYSFVGKDDDGSDLENTATFDFLNPKTGIHIQVDENKSLYVSYAVANREPNRSDFVDSSPNSQPVHETLYDTEIGYKYQSKNFTFGATGYLMQYDNQLILTGQINDVGAYTRTNIKDSYRAGIELEGALRITKKLLWQGNATYSVNKIKNFTEYVDNWDNWGQDAISYENTDIAFSPSKIWASKFSLDLSDNFGVQFISKYVGKQYIDNTQSEDRMLEDYLTHTGRVIWNVSSKVFSSVKLSLQVNNLFDERYVNNAWVYRFTSGGYDPRPDDAYVSANSEGGYDMAGYFPQATRNFLIGVTLGF